MAPISQLNLLMDLDKPTMMQLYTSQRVRGSGEASHDNHPSLAASIFVDKDMGFQAESVAYNLGGLPTLSKHPPTVQEATSASSLLRVHYN